MSVCKEVDVAVIGKAKILPISLLVVGLGVRLSSNIAYLLSCLHLLRKWTFSDIPLVDAVRPLAILQWQTSRWSVVLKAHGEPR